MESGAIPDDKIIASTFKKGYEARKARLNRNSSWMPMQDKSTEYIKIDFTSVTNVSAIATQGAPNVGCWVTRFSLQWFVNDYLVTDKKVQNIACKNSCSTRSSSLGTFREEERLRLSDRNSMLMIDVKSVQNPVISADWTME